MGRVERGGEGGRGGRGGRGVPPGVCAACARAWPRACITCVVDMMRSWRSHTRCPSVYASGKLRPEGGAPPGASASCSPPSNLALFAESSGPAPAVPSLLVSLAVPEATGAPEDITEPAGALHAPIGGLPCGCGGCEGAVRSQAVREASRVWEGGTGAKGVGGGRFLSASSSLGSGGASLLGASLISPSAGSRPSVWRASAVAGRSGTSLAAAAPECSRPQPPHPIDMVTE